MEITIERREGGSDFDFIYGDWTVHNRRLRNPLTGSNDWYEFDAEYTAQPIWKGKGNLDQFFGDSPLGFIEGLTLRIYNPQTRLWSLYWATSKNGLIVTPNVGSFDEHGVGEFFCNEEFDGKAIVSRYRWTQSYGAGCRWEQAFSADSGITWETNWIMEFTKK
ncbi:MAG TPA: hypothetical protein VFL13_03830 [Candidatus Baltobacteraceae bacterium]|nr:hypothetical protein [Candidatus Baltobacteraceae bacterium]